MFNLNQEVSVNLNGDLFTGWVKTNYNDGEIYAVEVHYKGKTYTVLVDPSRIKALNVKGLTLELH